jgi:hypothetical protein
METLIKEETKKTAGEDSYTARCTGLLRKTAKKRADNKPVHAGLVSKNDGPFYCPDCLSDAVVRKCTDKADHFAHQSRQSPVIGSKDYTLHHQCRDEICSELQRLYPEGNWAAERLIPANKDKGTRDRIPDVSGRINNLPIAIEVQASAYTLNKIYEKTCDYHKLGIAVIWIVPLKKELGPEPFRPRLYEKYLHSLYFGRAYYYLPGSKTSIIPVHYSPAKRYIEQNTWFDEYGDERTEGGYYLTYRTVKVPYFGAPITLEKNFKVTTNYGFTPKNGKKEIPLCKLFSDTLERWWDKDEYSSTEKQAEVIRNSQTEYKFIDEYDEYSNSHYEPSN